MNTNLDLRQLTVTREGAIAPARLRRRSISTRYVLPGVILLGFLGVLVWATGDSLVPRKAVTVLPVLATRAEVQQGGTPLFQSAGWVEARPTPVVVSALTEGIVEQLLVVEGQEVKAGQTVARLIDADARLALAVTQAEARMREAELTSARAALLAAETNLKYPVHLDAALAESDAMLAKVKTELAALPRQLEAAEAREKVARFTLTSRTKAFKASAIPEIEWRQAESDHKTAVAAKEELKAREPWLKREAEALMRKSAALRKRLELKADEVRQASETQAAVRSAEARLQQTRVGIDIAQLRLERMTVKAPSSGRVLALVARPGTRLMGLASGTAQESSTVVTLYDPQWLQVRADVRLDDVPRLQTGQPVRIETPAVPGGPLEGEMLFATAITDIQKNTLQVKVAIKSPPTTLKPDMLVTVTFLAPPTTARSASSEQLRLFVPRQLVESSAGGTHVWIADLTARKARRKTITPGQGTLGDLVEVIDGLTPADKVIATGREGLTDGQRITVTGDDAGMASPSHEPKSKPKRLPVSPREKPGPKGKK
jgi:RND family efflux transporter MFP subunit